MYTFKNTLHKERLHLKYRQVKVKNILNSNMKA